MLILQGVDPKAQLGKLITELSLAPVYSTYNPIYIFKKFIWSSRSLMVTAVAYRNKILNTKKKIKPLDVFLCHPGPRPTGNMSSEPFKRVEGGAQSLWGIMFPGGKGSCMEKTFLLVPLGGSP